METRKTRRFTGRSVIAATLLMAAFLTMIAFSACKPNDNGGGKPDTIPPPPKDDSAGYWGFRNSVSNPPAGYSGPVFQLSYDYPTALPAGGDDMPWLKIPVDFTDETPDFESGHWREYIMAIFDYCMRGQDPNLTNEAGFNHQVDGKDAWYHVPWMAYNTAVGREFAHGCTSERIASMADIDGDGDMDEGTMVSALPLKDGSSTFPRFETWAVGMYNDYAGYAMGQAFPKDGPNKGKAQTEVKNGMTLPVGLPFTTGSAVVKVLFTTATDKDASYLKGSPEWMVDRHEHLTDSTFGCSRALQPVHLLQMDVAVVDPRSPTHWVFGTFGYNGTLPGKTAMERMDPIGIQFGSDPQSCPSVAPAESKPIYQSVINKKVNIYEHLGCGKRLDGPVDNPISSCMSCHGASFTAPMNELDKMGTNVPAIFGFEGMCNSAYPANKYYFGNRVFPEPYGDPQFANDIPLDFSLQLLVAFGQYKQYAIVGAPDNCAAYSPSNDTVENDCQ